jgi:hypothetical protein
VDFRILDTKLSTGIYATFQYQELSFLFFRRDLKTGQSSQGEERSKLVGHLALASSGLR